MIFNNLSNINTLKGLDNEIKEALNYAISNNLLEYEKGSYEIKGKDIFLNRVTYNTKADEDGFWEGHKEYIDIHLILKGKERIDYNLKESLKLLNYDKEGDFLSFEGLKKQSLILEEGDFAIFYPEDIHMTGLTLGKEEKVNKVIFKVRF